MKAFRLTGARVAPAKGGPGTGERFNRIDRGTVLGLDEPRGEKVIQLAGRQGARDRGGTVASGEQPSGQNQNRDGNSGMFLMHNIPPHAVMCFRGHAVRIS